MDFPYKLLSSSPALGATSRFLSLPDFLSRVSSSKIVWFGEFHSEARICAFLDQLVRSLHDGASGASSSSSSAPTGSRRLHVVCEHFSFEMDDILRQYQGEQSLNFDQFVQAYRDIGTEGHKLDEYRSMLEYCRDHADTIQLHGGFIPRPCASAYMKASTDEEKMALYRSLSEEKDYLPD